MEASYYLFSEDKGADQLTCSRAADLRFAFAYSQSRLSHEMVIHMTEYFFERAKKISCSVYSPVCVAPGVS